MYKREATLHIHLPTPTADFCSMSKPEIIGPGKIKKDDKMIALIGPTGCGKSNFIDHLTKSTKWSKPDLRTAAQGVRAVRIRLYNTSIVLVDTPGFDDADRSDDSIAELIGKWLQKTKGIRLTGILYLHRITDNRMAGMASRSLSMFGKLCGDNATEKVIFVTTMWDQISENKGKKREDELFKNHWRPLLELGVQTARFLQNDDACAQDIVQRLIDSSTGAALLQEGTVDNNRAIVETEAAEAGRTLYTNMQRLHSQHQQTLSTLREVARKTTNPQLLAGLQIEEARLQAELDKCFNDARKLKMPLTRRIMLFFSKAQRAT